MRFTGELLTLISCSVACAAAMHAHAVHKVCSGVIDALSKLKIEAPAVSVNNQVETPSVEVHNDVQTPDVHVEAPNIDIHNDVQTPDVHVINNVDQPAAPTPTVIIIESDGTGASDVEHPYGSIAGVNQIHNRSSTVVSVVVNTENPIAMRPNEWLRASDVSRFMINGLEYKAGDYEIIDSDGGVLVCKLN